MDVNTVSVSARFLVEKIWIVKMECLVAEYSDFIIFEHPCNEVDTLWGFRVTA